MSCCMHAYIYRHCFGVVLLAVSVHLWVGVIVGLCTCAFMFMTYVRHYFNLYVVCCGALFLFRCLVVVVCVLSTLNSRISVLG